MYGLPQAGFLAQLQLIHQLNTHGYHLTHGLFLHVTNNVSFSLVVDDVLVKYPTTESANHLHQTL